MTNMKLQQIIGKVIEDVNALEENGEMAVFVLRKAEVISALAKREIASHAQVIQADKMSGRTDRTNKVVGE